MLCLVAVAGLEHITLCKCAHLLKMSVHPWFSGPLPPETLTAPWIHQANYSAIFLKTTRNTDTLSATVAHVSAIPPLPRRSTLMTHPKRIETTPEQSAAIDWLRLMGGATSLSAGPHARVILDMLPAELTDPLPEEHGVFYDSLGDLWWLDSGGWHDTAGSWLDSQARDHAPFTRLVPERPQVTREQIPELVGAAYKAGNPGGVLFNDALYAAITQVVNGDPR